MKFGKTFDGKHPQLLSGSSLLATCSSLVKVLAIVLAGVLLQACASNDEGLTEKNAREAAQYNAQLGANFLQKGNLEQARDTLDKALAQDENNALVHVVYGQLKHRIDEPEAARMHFERAIKLDPDQASHRNSFGVFLCQIKEYAQAEQQFSIAADNKFYPTPEYALDNAGVCFLDANNLDKAEGYLREALRNNPEFPNAYLHMSELLYKRDRLTVAEAYLDRFKTRNKGDTAESLLLSIHINRDSDREAEAEQYASRLLNDFPTSREAGEYLSRPLQ